MSSTAGSRTVITSGRWRRRSRLHWAISAAAWSRSTMSVKMAISARRRWVTRTWVSAAVWSDSISPGCKGPMASSRRRSWAAPLRGSTVAVTLSANATRPARSPVRSATCSSRSAALMAWSNLVSGPAPTPMRRPWSRHAITGWSRSELGAVAGAQRHVQQQKCRVDGVVELGEWTGADAHEAAVVETRDHGLVALRRQLGRHEPAGPRGGPPVDVAQGVVGHGLADTLEVRALAVAANRSDAELLQLSAPRQCLVDAHRGDVGIDAHRRGLRSREVTCPQPPRAKRTHVHMAEPGVAAGARRERVADVAGTVPCEHLRRRLHRGGSVIAQAQGGAARGADGQRHRVGGTHREEAVEAALHLHAVRPGRAPRVDDDHNHGDGR